MLCVFHGTLLSLGAALKWVRARVGLRSDSNTASGGTAVDDSIVPLKTAEVTFLICYFRLLTCVDFPATQFFFWCDCESNFFGFQNSGGTTQATREKTSLCDLKTMN